MNFFTYLSLIVLSTSICPICADVANKGMAMQEDPDSKSMVQVQGVEQSSLKRPLINEHEWVEITNIHRVLGAEVKAAQATSEHNHRISRIRDSVKPLYTVMPKDDDGSLSKETARYALHRYFTEKHGWSIKGLQPAGAAWQHVMTVESDMTDINKYMLPAYMEDAVVSLMNKTKIDLEVLAVMISTYEHLDHQTMLATMQSILATFDMTSGGVKSEDEVREILEAYLIVYAFGVDIDTKNKYEIRDTKANLQLNHPAWGSLASFMWDIKMQMFPKSALDFGELAHVALAFGDKYAKWQEEDCSRAQNYFVGMPSFRHGSVRLLDVSPSSSLGRRTLFEETLDFVSDLGVVTHKTHSKHARLVVPNYLSSQSMCLATASFHSVCCENKCESLYTRLEQGVGAPAATAEQIADLADSLPGQKHDWSMQDLKDMADEEGKIKLHSRSFAKWMHHTFPLECPLPLGSGHATNPKTPDEWMDSCQDCDAPLPLFADFLKQIATAWDVSMGKLTGNMPSRIKAESQASDRDVIFVTLSEEVAKDTKSPVQWYFLALIPSAFFLAATVFHTVKYGARCLTTSFDESTESAGKDTH